MVRMRKLPGVVATGLGARAVCFIGKIQTNPKIFRGGWSESVRRVGQEDIDVRDRRDILETQSFAICRGKRQKIRAVGLRGLGRLFGLENKYSFLLAVEQHHCAWILQTGEIVEIVVFAIVDSLGDFVASEQDYGSGLATLG